MSSTWIWLLWACTGSKPDDTHGETGDSGPVVAGYSILADEIGEGVLLSAWSAGDELLAVGGALGGDGPGVMARWDGETLCTETLVEDAALWWIHGPSDTEWWAVGERGTVVHSVEGEVTRDDVSTDMTLFGVWDDGENTWVVGGDVNAGTGGIWKRGEAGWEQVLATEEGVVFKVWDRWFVGDEVAWLLDDAGVFQPFPPGERLLTVRGSATDAVYAVGGVTGSAARKWTGSAWQELDTAGLSAPLNGVWTAPGENVWVAGMMGVQGFSDDGGSSWKIPDFPLTVHHFHAVWKHQDAFLFLGGNLMSAAGPWFGTIGRWGMPRSAVTASDCPGN